VLIHDFIRDSAATVPSNLAVRHRDLELTYDELWDRVQACARGLVGFGLAPSERVAVYLPKELETVIGLFGAAAAGGAFVPINPVLKPAQVAYILNHCNVRVLITSVERAKLLEEVARECRDLRTIVLTSGELSELPESLAKLSVSWASLLDSSGASGPHRRIDQDMTAILYTSGSTGKPKGVVLSHRNMVVGAISVSSYLENSASDRLLAVLPFSFDYGLSQLTTAFKVGASAVLMDYLLPRDVVRAVGRERITGLAAVPPLWNQIAQLPWPEEAVASLRYITNTGGAMPVATTERLRKALPNTRVYLMYGLTEAFRSTYLPPDQVGIRPDSIGKAIPNAEVMVVREDGTECAPGEPGELVHRGSLVALGYWNDPETTAQRFKPAPGRLKELPIVELAAWSGDQVRRDEEGFLYFESRKDDMIKTSGYRVSPTEVEEVVYATGLVVEAVAIGIPHPLLGQAILVLAHAGDAGGDAEAVVARCRQELPTYMVPQEVRFLDSLPRNANGKIDRKMLAQQHQDIFRGQVES
jgi:acyl-CoA ligase (AMP-forming) (exosortase A-associated)